MSLLQDKRIAGLFCIDLLPSTDRASRQCSRVDNTFASMAEDWEDWENDDFTPQLPAAAPQAAVAVDDVEASKFAGEDEEEDKPQYNVPKPQQVHRGWSVIQQAGCCCIAGLRLTSWPGCAVETWEEKDI